MIVGGRMCGLCGDIVTARTIHAHYAHKHGVYTTAGWILARWPDGERVFLFVDDESLDLAVTEW